MGRKLNVLSLSKKAEIINEAKNGVSITALSKKYNTAKSTICGIVKNENKILECVNNTLSGPGKRKTLRASELPKMEKKLYMWFLLQRGLIRVMFMPPNVTPLIQPMDQNAIRITKLHYRNSLLAAIFSDDCDLIQSLKKISLRDAVTFLDRAWNKLRQETLAKCWTNILNFANLKDDDDDDIPLSVLKNQIEAEAKSMEKEAAEILEHLHPEATFTEEEIRDWNNDDLIEEVEAIEESESEDEVEATGGNEQKRISSSEAVTIFNKAIAWATAEKISPRKVNVLQSLREKAVLNAVENKKHQTKITAFFSNNL